MEPLTETATQALEAFADTILPGEKRGPDDRAIAGVSAGGGAVAAGAVALLSHPATGFAEVLGGLAAMLEGHGIVELSFDERTELLRRLLAPDNPERTFWVGLAMFCTMAFDSAPHMSTVDAVASGHPGLATIGYASPDGDGLWRFPAFSYGRPLSRIHPNTTPTGSPA
jgi:hypothetical protein